MVIRCAGYTPRSHPILAVAPRASIEGDDLYALLWRYVWYLSEQWSTTLSQMIGLVPVLISFAMATKLLVYDFGFDEMTPFEE
jgi:hypothetical protein